jgi:hypothetical protein
MVKVPRKLPYREGTWFAVPLETGGYGVGIVARMDGKGGIFAYFFGPKLAAVPALAAVRPKRKSEAVWLCQLGDLGFLEGNWAVIGKCGDWRREEWPLPPFIHVDVVSGETRMRRYTDDLRASSDEPCSADLAAEYPRDGVFGYRAAESRFTRILDELEGKARGN